MNQIIQMKVISNFYEIDTDSDEEQLPTYPITNLDITHFENDLPELVPYDQDDIVSDWNHEILDSGPQSGPFLGHTETNINDPDGNPEVFFNGLFDDRMWTILSEATNTYARSKCQSRWWKSLYGPRSSRLQETLQVEFLG